MFKELLPVIQNRALTITVAAVAGGKIRVCVIPKSLDSDGKVNDKVYNKEIAKIPEEAIKALTTPLAITKTAEELDAELVAILRTYAANHLQLQHTIENASQEITAAIKAVDERNRAKSKTKPDQPSHKEDSDSATGKPSEERPQGDTLPLVWAMPTPPAAVSANDNNSNIQEVSRG